MIPLVSTSKLPSPTEAFSYEEITAHIQAFIDDEPRGTQQRLAEAAFPEMKPKDASTEFRHRMNERANARFSYEQLGAMAMAAGKLKGRPEGAPLGWPILTWLDAEAVESVLRAIRSARV
jgi:hypothetical protein